MDGVGFCRNIKFLDDVLDLWINNMIWWLILKSFNVLFLLLSFFINFVCVFFWFWFRLIGFIILIVLFSVEFLMIVIKVLLRYIFDLIKFVCDEMCFFCLRVVLGLEGLRLLSGKVVIYFLWRIMRSWNFLIILIWVILIRLMIFIGLWSFLLCKLVK